MHVPSVTSKPGSLKTGDDSAMASNVSESSEIKETDGEKLSGIGVPGKAKGGTGTGMGRVMEGKL